MECTQPLHHFQIDLHDAQLNPRKRVVSVGSDFNFAGDVCPDLQRRMGVVGRYFSAHYVGRHRASPSPSFDQMLEFEVLTSTHHDKVHNAFTCIGRFFCSFRSWVVTHLNGDC